MELQTNDIPEFFDAYGWQYERESSGLFRTGFVGDSGHYEIWLRITEQWIYFTINPFLKPEEGGQHSEAVLEALLKANYDLNLAKFALDDEGDLLLAVELPRAGFSYSHFADALTALSHYADLYREPLEAAGREEPS